MMRGCWVGAALMVGVTVVAAADDYRDVFNGKDLDGWKHVGPGRFVIENGALRTEGGMGLLWYTREKFGDTTIRVVYRTQAQGGGNAGVFIRIPTEPDEPWMPVNKLV